MVLAAPRPSPLRDLEGEDGVLKVFTGGPAKPEDPVVVLVDDAEVLEDCDAEDVMKRIIERGAEEGLALVIAGDEDEICDGFSGWQVDAKKARRGVLLSPQETSSGELIGIRTTRSMVGGPITPGKGMLHLGSGDPLTVTTPA